MKRLLLAFIVAILASVPASGQHFGIAARIGTAGIGGEVGYSVTPKLNLRGRYSTFSYSRQERGGDDPELIVDGESKLGAVMLFFDLHPFGNTFRLTAGVGHNQFDVRATAMPAGNVCLGGENEAGVCDGKEFTPDKLGTLFANVTYPSSIHPYAGIGFGNLARGSSVITFLFDAGVMYVGSPEITLRNDGLFAPTTTKENVQTLKDGIESFQWYPIVSLGIGFRF